MTVKLNWWVVYDNACHGPGAEITVPEEHIPLAQFWIGMGDAVDITPP